MNGLVMLCRAFLPVAFTLSAIAAPVIDQIPSATVPAGKSLIVPITVTVTNGRPLTFTITSSTNAIAVVPHTNNPFWKLNVVQAAATNAPGAFTTPFRGGTVTVTNMGDLTFMLFPEYAPHTVSVFQGLTDSGFYSSNTIFHRVVASFVIQGGDPLTNGTGGLVFKYDDEFNPQAIFSGNGQLALANSGKDTDGSQFFVTVGQQRFLDLGYTLFGQLLRGFNVLSNINNTAVTNSRPLADVIITQAGLVPDTSDTVVTLTTTNRAGVVGTITVIADDGASGRATNTFTATTAADANIESPILYPTTVTNLVAPANARLTNMVTGYDFPGVTNNWLVYYADYISSVSATSSFYNVVSNQLQIVVVPNSNYLGSVGLNFYVSSTTNFSTYDQQLYTFVFGDTPIVAQPVSITPQTSAPFTNLLLATFTNGVVGSAATNFSAAINWGDDSITAGVITTNAAKFKQVFGAHAYTNSGDYPVYITIQSLLGVTAIVSNTITVMPPLKLNRTGTNNVIAWPSWAFAYQLQSNTNLAGTNWLAVTNVSTLTGFQNAVSNPAPAARFFFRLKK